MMEINSCVTWSEPKVLLDQCRPNLAVGNRIESIKSRIFESNGPMIEEVLKLSELETIGLSLSLTTKPWRRARRTAVAVGASATEEGFPKLFKRLRRQGWGLESQTDTSRVLQPEVEQKTERQKTFARQDVLHRWWCLKQPTNVGRQIHE